MKKDIHPIRKLIELGESQTLDFKFAINDSRKIARSLVAFANSDGGTLLIGVRDNGSIAGIRSGEELHMVDTASFMYCRPEVKLDKHLWNIEGKEVLEVKIARQHSSSLFSVKEENNKEQVYIRIQDENVAVNSVYLSAWAKKHQDKGIKLSYTEREKEFLKLFESDEYFTLEELKKQSNFSTKYLKLLLINFIALDFILIHFFNQGIYYQRNNHHKALENE